MKKKSRKEPTKSPQAAWAADAGIPFQQVRALIDLLEERGLEEFEMERGGIRIRIKRQSAATAAVAPASNPAAGPAAATGSARPEVAAEIEVPGEDVHIVRSPIVGTFYATPRPDAPPFVQVGDGVTVGQVLCIVEAMKLMNEIEADVAGEVTRIYVENAQPVEYNEPLFGIRPT